MDNTEKTLVILTPGFAKDETDTTCLPMQQQLIRQLKNSYPGLGIIILSFQYPYHSRPYRWYDMQVYPFNGKNKGGLPRLLLRRKIYSRLNKIHKTTPVSAILSFWYGECAVVGKQFADKYKAKYFCWILGQDIRKNNKYPKRIQLISSELVALSDFLQTEFEKNHGVKPSRLLLPGIDTKQFKETGAERDIDILGAGSLIPLKQYDLLVEIVAELKKQIPGINAMLIGKGKEMERLQLLIGKAGLKSSIKLTGEIPYGEVLEKMQRAKLFLHPSSAEGFSGVCLEALYAGAHVISFCKAMNREIRHWHIVNSKEEMIRVAMSLLSHKELNHERVLFNPIENTAKMFMDLLSENSVPGPYKNLSPERR
jgi:glycosyltransferase involved in cell wall biosynthesis